MSVVVPAHRGSSCSGTELAPKAEASGARSSQPTVNSGGHRSLHSCGLYHLDCKARATAPRGRVYRRRSPIAFPLERKERREFPRGCYGGRGCGLRATRSRTCPAVWSMLVRRLPSCRLFANSVSSDAMIDSQGGGPGQGQRGQISSLSMNAVIEAFVAAMNCSAAALFVMFLAASFELSIATKNATDHGTGSGLSRDPSCGSTSFVGSTHPSGVPCTRGRGRCHNPKYRLRGSRGKGILLTSCPKFLCGSKLDQIPPAVYLKASLFISRADNLWTSRGIARPYRNALNHRDPIVA
jgi:hypothetical protein